jgi:hypothetical protein
MLKEKRMSGKISNSLAFARDFTRVEEVELDEITSTWETAGMDHDFDATFGTIKAGHTAAIRWTMTGMYKGSPPSDLPEDRAYPQRGGAAV